MAAGQKTTPEQSLSAAVSYASPKWQKQWDQTGSLPHTLCYSWWKNTFLALASKSHSSKSQLVCGQRVLAARLACFGKPGERKHGYWKPVRIVSPPKKAEMGWLTWQQICLTATSGSILPKHKCSSCALHSGVVCHCLLLRAPCNFHHETLHLVVYGLDKSSTLG